MAAAEFRNFLGQIGIQEETAARLLAGNIDSAKRLASSKTSVISDLVDDPVLINTILPMLQKYAFPIAMAADPHAHALHLLRRDASGNDQKVEDQSVSSDSSPFMPGSERVGTTTTERVENIRPRRDYSRMDENEGRFFTLGESGARDRTEDYHRGTFGNATREVNKGNSTSVNISGGNFVQTNFGDKPATFINTNSTLNVTSYVDTEKARTERRSRKLESSTIRLPSNVTFSTSDLRFRDNADYWLDQVSVEPISDQEYERSQTDEFTYPVKEWNRNRALIINNINFLENSPARKGADVDSFKLRDCLQRLGFKVDVFENRRKREMEQKLREFASSRDNQEAFISLVFIGSHGERNENEDYFIGIDDARMSVKEVSEFFSEAKCPSLRGKPKLFFFQFCRRDRRIAAGDAVEDNVPSDAQPFQSQDVEGDAGLDNEPAPLPQAQNYANMLWSYATAAGTKAYRDVEYGSWYVTSLCKVLQEHAKSKDLLSMLTMVNGMVMAESGNENGRTVVQMADTRHHLTKNVRFYPRSISHGN